MSGLFKTLGYQLYSLICAAKDFGVTEFINPNDHDEPIQQVIDNLTKLLRLETSFFIYYQ